MRRQPSTPGIPGIRLPDDDDSEEPLHRAARAYRALDERLTRVEASVGFIPQLQKDVSELNELLTGAKAALKHVLGKGILLIIGAVGTTFGVSKATETHSPPVVVAPTKSAYDRALDGCGSESTEPNNLGVSPHALCIERAYRASR